MTEERDAAEGAAHGDAGAGLVQLVALVDRLQQENRVLAGQVGFLTAQLGAAEARILALTAPASPLVGSGAPEPPDLTPEPFWSRWRTSAPLVLLVVILLLAFAVEQPACALSEVCP